MHQESLQATTTNLQFPLQKKRLRHPTLGSFMNVSLREPYSKPKLENPILACFKAIHAQPKRLCKKHTQKEPSKRDTT